MKTNSRRTIIGAAAILISSIAFSGALGAPTSASAGTTAPSTVSTTAPASTTSTTATTGEHPLKALLEAYHAQIKAYITQQRADLISKIQALNIPDNRKSTVISKLQERWAKEDAHMAKMTEEREQHRESRTMTRHNSGTSTSGTTTGTSTSGTSTSGTSTSGTTTTTQGL